MKIAKFVLCCSLISLAMQHSPRARASTSNGTTLLLVHGYTDTCDTAFNEIDVPANAGPNAITTINYLSQHGWPESNIDDIGYYDPSAVFPSLRFDGSTIMHGDGTRVFTDPHRNKCDHNLFDFTTDNPHTRGCPIVAEGTTNEPIRSLACKLAWYIFDRYTSQGRPVAILAHSMGGLIVRDALAESGFNITGFPLRKLDVRRVVTVATPHTGLQGGYLQFARTEDTTEIEDMAVGSRFLQAIGTLQAPQGSARTFWGLMAASVPCTLLGGTGTSAADCFEHDNAGLWPDGDGIVQAESAMSLDADYKVLYGGGDSNGQRIIADATTEYSHSSNSCHVFGVPICLNPPFYLNDGRAGNVNAFVCTSNCTFNLAHTSVGDLGTVPHSLAQIVALLPAPFRLTTPSVTSVSPSMATFDGRLYVALTGTDTHLNLRSSVDGINFDSNLPILQTSNFGPSIAGFNNLLWIAWEGTDAAHHVSMMSYNGSSLSQPTVLSAITTSHAPAIAAFGGKLYLAWVGTDAGHHLNLASSTDGIHFTNPPTVLPDTALDAPALNAFGGQLVLAWTGTDSAHHLNIATTTDGITFNKRMLSETSPSGPALGHNNGLLDLAWVGTDTHLNVESALSAAAIGMEPTNKLTLGDRSSVAPAICSFDSQVYIAWSGADAPPHLNVAATY